MYGTLSWIFGLFITPLNWILVLVLISVFSKNAKRKKRALITAFIFLMVFSNKFLLEMYARAWTVDPVPLEKGKVYSAAIILGGFTNETKDGTGFYNDHADRLLEGVKLRLSGKVASILISGGNERPNDGFTEADYVHQTLREMNFPDSTILVENKSTNTVTNAKFSRKMLDAKHLKPPYILVTSAFHMRRSMYIYKANGMDVIPYPCDYIGGNNKLNVSDYFLPSGDTLYHWNYYIKEFFGLIVAHIKAT